MADLGEEGPGFPPPLIEAIRISALKLKMLSADDCVLPSSGTLILYKTMKAC